MPCRASFLFLVGAYFHSFQDVLSSGRGSKRGFSKVHINVSGFLKLFPLGVGYLTFFSPWRRSMGCRDRYGASDDDLDRKYRWALENSGLMIERWICCGRIYMQSSFMVPNREVGKTDPD